MRESTPIDLSVLAEARVQLHYAAQLVAAVNRAWLPARPDDAHTALRWDASGEIQGQTIPGAEPWHAALHVESLSFICEGQHSRRQVSLEGKTVAEALAAAQALLDDTLGSDSRPLTWPSYDLPDHPLGEGAPFPAVNVDAMAAWTHWFDHAAEYLEELHADRPGSSPARLWPHHFDMAVLLDLGDGKSVNVGLSAGDAHYAEPYWYVTPWPRPPATAALTECDGGGHWHTDGFVAAVLPAHDVRGYPEGQVRAFLAAAIPAAEALPGA